ncbi:MAG TPA: DUF1285 domain-containing protein [Porticoccaceae bacterium]|nr:DUF1285 domain-containing protein [Porticoccaceae bacterium]
MTESLVSQLKDRLNLMQGAETALPPVALWDTPLNGDIDIFIDREGRWIHEGGEIKRPALVALFSSILRREGDDYFLVTPYEKWRIRVAIAPFFVIDASLEQSAERQVVKLITRTGEAIAVGIAHPLWIEQSDTPKQPIPLVMVRDNMPALLSRSVFYQLVSWGTENLRKETLEIHSMGTSFHLGPIS